MDFELPVKFVEWYVIITWMPIIPKFLIFLSNPSDIEQMTSLIEFTIINGVIPWWISPLEFLSTISGIIGSILTIGFIFFLAKNDLL